MSKNDKWIMFKNYMHNELDITKEDIYKWVKEAVRDETRALVKHQYDKFSLEDTIKNRIFCNEDYFSSRKELKAEIKDKIAKLVFDDLKFSIKVE